MYKGGCMQYQVYKLNGNGVEEAITRVFRQDERDIAESYLGKYQRESIYKHFIRKINDNRE